MSRVWVYPERKYEEFGAIRWEVSTDIVLPEAMDSEEIDIDRDIRQKAWGLPTYEKAKAYAEKVLNRTDLAFGAVYIQKQVVDWYVEEDRIGEWVDVGEAEEVTK